MKLIPVLDIKNTQVVLAKAGLREQYRPIHTALCQDPSPTAVIHAFLGIYPFDTFYIADLDAIEGSASNNDIIHQLSTRFNQLKFLIDRGIPDPTTEYSKFTSPVLGSESYIELDQLQKTLQEYEKFEVHLSFDYKNGQLLGCNDLEQQPALWPKRIIILDISAVGTEYGFNFDLITRFRALRPDLNITIGGGLRTVEQLRTAAASGVDSVLVASCLHHQLVSRYEIDQLREA